MSVYKGDKIISIYKGDKLIADSMAAGTSTVTPQYIRDQNLLDMTNEASKFELIMANLKDKAVQMPYDGVISFGANYIAAGEMYILDANKVEKYRCILNDAGKTGGAAQMQFNKGDYIYKLNDVTSPYIRFYKKRDYAGR